MNIDTMLPGKELDALVRDILFGKPAQEFTTDGKHLVWICPEYSTEISSAWLVVEEINRRGMSWWFSNTTDKVDPCWANVRRESDRYSFATAKAQTLPEAICKAALFAVL